MTPDYEKLFTITPAILTAAQSAQLATYLNAGDVASFTSAASAWAATNIQPVVRTPA